MVRSLCLRCRESANCYCGYSYLYDGDGQRVEKCTEGTTPGTCATGATGTLYWRGNAESDALKETDLAGNVQNNYIFFDGQRVARSDSAGAVHYYFSDHLGSHGVVENATASVCEQDIDYYPYGGWRTIIAQLLLRTTSSPAKNGTRSQG